MPDPEPIVSVSVAKDGLSATLHIPPGREVTLENLLDAMRQRQVVLDPARVKLAEALLERHKADPDQGVDGVVATGCAPVAGRDAHVVIDESLTAAPPTPEQVGEGVDHYANSAFTIVRAGQIIGRFVPEEPPVPGFDVTGQPIEAEGGAPLDLSASDSIRVTDDNEIIAQTAGALIHDDPENIHIISSLTISEYVDFSTGNIDFPGDVAIGKGVRDRFTVRADRSITIKEHVEGAQVVAGLDVTIAKGMSGHERGRLRAGRDLKAKYVNASTVTVGRDAEIEKEMVDTFAVIGRSLRAPRCTVVGGSITVGAESEVAQIGSEAGAPTEVILGRYPQLDRLARPLADLLADAQKRSLRKATRLEQLQAAGKLTPEQSDELGSLRRDVGRTNEKLRSARAALEAAWGMVKRASPSLIVHRTIYAGSRITLGEHRAEFRQDVAGPVRIDLDGKAVPRATDLTGNSSTPLAKLARVVPNDELLDWAHLTRTTGEIADAA